MHVNGIIVYNVLIEEAVDEEEEGEKSSESESESESSASGSEESESEVQHKTDSSFYCDLLCKSFFFDSPQQVRLRVVNQRQKR